MKVDTLVQDIYSLLERPVIAGEENVRAFSIGLATKLAARLAAEPQGHSLRLSNWARCLRQHYLLLKYPEEVPATPPQDRLKFIIGDIFEEVLIYLARASGHRVEGEQGELILSGVEGHRDAIIDGRTVDIKSASPYSFEKFLSGGLRSDDEHADAFGYMGQIGSYVSAAADDPLVLDKTKGSFLAGNKVTGELTLDTHEFTPEFIETELHFVREELEECLERDITPDKYYTDKPFGKSGNRSLGVSCSYCPVKHLCWENLRAFKYSDGVKFLTKVEKEPKVQEVPTH